jgi:methionine--tRNA ligase beta chain
MVGKIRERIEIKCLIFNPMPEISYEDFTKIDLRVGQVVEAENIPKSRNLLKIMVDLGEETPRQIVSGISNEYEPEELIGQKVVVLVNLKPRKLMGIESQGMLLAADVDDTAVLLKIDGKYIDNVTPGTVIR